MSAPSSEDVNEVKSDALSTSPYDTISFRKAQIILELVHAYESRERDIAAAYQKGVADEKERLIGAYEEALSVDIGNIERKLRRRGYDEAADLVAEWG